MNYDLAKKLKEAGLVRKDFRGYIDYQAVHRYNTPEEAAAHLWLNLYEK